MSLGPAGEIVRLAANRQARRAPDYRCVSKAATIATPMPSWCTAALGQQQPRGRGRRCLRTQARTQVSVPRVSRVSKHASTPSELAATMSADPLGHRAAETEPVEGPAPVSATLERADAHERLGGVRFSIGCGPVRLSNGSTVEGIGVRRPPAVGVFAGVGPAADRVRSVCRRRHQRGRPGADRRGCGCHVGGRLGVGHGLVRRLAHGDRQVFGRWRLRR